MIQERSRYLPRKENPILKCKKRPALPYGKAGLICGAADRTRTGTVFTPRDFHATLCCHSRQVRRCSPDFIFAMTKRF